MELRQLKYFVKAAETLNFSDAARALNIAQSSLSQQIKQLEEELDMQLFLRNSHSIRLTEAGEMMLPLALRTIHDAETCTDRIRDLKKLLTGTLNIGVTHSFSPILTETVVSFMKLYPGIKLNIVYKQMNELMELLAGRDIDFVLAFKPSCPMPDVESHILFQNSLAAVVSSSHPLARQEKVILLKLVRQTHLVTVLAEDSIYNEHDVKAVPLAVPANEMAGCVHVLKDTYHKQSMREFVRLLSESLAVKQRQNSWL